MYEEINRIKEYPNFVSAGIIGYCLNVLGVSEDGTTTKERVDFTPVQRAAVRWAKHNYLKLHKEYPAVAEAILVGGVSFDPEAKRLIKTYASMFGKSPAQKYLQLIG